MVKALSELSVIANKGEAICKTRDQKIEFRMRNADCGMKKSEILNPQSEIHNQNTSPYHSGEIATSSAKADSSQ